MKEIELYTQPECPPCEIVKLFFQHHQLTYTEYNIKVDTDAARRLTEQYQAYSTPTVIINGEAVIGFNIERLEQLLQL
ncbi:thioredoxin family protein [Ectobacillus sp. JY-23]|uniref:glutaredoxin domain-containing protein n=1 Tax=Ectobacillus sp. JY-23 TaxID=2933872 RepID=UPI001FF5FCA7|nr:glutaredoxin domain-containing protein [Ectobacillus sp. JY-23]UOY93803.1 thioredoxin family protein [Ectobacillus sp. JY-23]